MGITFYPTRAYIAADPRMWGEKHAEAKAVTNLGLRLGMDWLKHRRERGMAREEAEAKSRSEMLKGLIKAGHPGAIREAESELGLPAADLDAMGGEGLSADQARAFDRYKALAAATKDPGRRNYYMNKALGIVGEQPVGAGVGTVPGARQSDVVTGHRAHIRREAVRHRAAAAGRNILPGTERVMELAQKYGAQHDVDPNVLYNLAGVESSYNPRAYNRKYGAAGLYQFIPSTAKQYNVDPYDPESATSGAARYLRDLLDENEGDYGRALSVYGGFKKEDPTNYINSIMPAGRVAGGVPGIRQGPEQDWSFSTAQGPQEKFEGAMAGELGRQAAGLNPVQAWELKNKIRTFKTSQTMARDKVNQRHFDNFAKRYEDAWKEYQYFNNKLAPRTNDMGELFAAASSEGDKKRWKMARMLARRRMKASDAAKLAIYNAWHKGASQEQINRLSEFYLAFPPVVTGRKATRSNIPPDVYQDWVRDGTLAKMEEDRLYDPSPEAGDPYGTPFGKHVLGTR